MSNEMTDISIAEEEALPVIDKTSNYHVGTRLIYDYNRENGVLCLDIDKQEYNDLISKLKHIPEKGASICFDLPEKGEVCFLGVHKVERLIHEVGFIRRITRLFRRNVV